MTRRSAFPTLRRTALLAAVTTLLVTAAAPTASAEWQAAETLSLVGQSGSAPIVATNASGDAVAAWSVYSVGMQVTDRSAGGPWAAAPTALSTPGTEVPNREVVIDSTGAITALWGEYTMTGAFPFPMPGPTTIFTAQRPAGGTWSTPEQLSSVGVNAGQAGLAVGADDGVAAVWVEGAALMSATRTRAGAWSATDTATPSGATNSAPQVALDEDGTLTAAWQAGGGTPVRSATQAAGAAWSTPVEVVPSGAYVPRLAMNAAGDATLVWLVGGSKHFAARRAAAGGTWSAPEQFSVDGAVSYYAASLVVDADGRATAAWAQAEPAGAGVRYDQKAATRSVAGTWGTPVTLGVGSSEGLAISAGAAGDVAAAWRGVTALQASSHAAGDSWSAATDVAVLGSGRPNIDVDDQGNVLVIAATSGARIFALADDVSGPLLHNLSIPASASAGSTVTFGVSPLDVWSNPSTTAWDFGDGTIATDATPTHVYTTEGDKTVTVTATDALGHTTTQTATHTVTPAVPTTDPEPTPTDPGTGNNGTGDPAAPTTPTPPTTDLTAPTTGAAPECVSRRIVTLRWTLPAGQKPRTTSLKVTGKATRRLGRSTRAVKVDLRGARAGTITVTVRTRSTSGRLLTGSRKYRTCEPRPTAPQPYKLLRLRRTT